MLPEILKRYAQRIEESFKPLSFEELIQKGVRSLRADRPDIARHDFINAIRLQPSNPTAWTLYGVSLLGEIVIYVRNPKKTDELSEIYYAFAKATELEPSSANYFNEAEVYRWANQPDKALDKLNKALESNPSDSLLLRIIRDMEIASRYHTASEPSSRSYNLQRINFLQVD